MTPRSIPKSARRAITCTHVIRIFFVIEKELKRWEYREKIISVTSLFLCFCFSGTTDTWIIHILLIPRKYTIKPYELGTYNRQIHLTISPRRLDKARTINLFYELLEIINKHLIFDSISFTIDEICSEDKPIFLLRKIGIFEDVFEV